MNISPDATHGDEKTLIKVKIPKNTKRIFSKQDSQVQHESSEWLDNDDTPIQSYTQPTKKERKITFDKKHLIICFAECIIGFLILAFGIINAGSYYTAGTRFSGTLADIFYLYQFGTILIVCGVCIVYDSVKRTGYV